MTRMKTTDCAALCGVSYDTFNELSLSDPNFPPPLEKSDRRGKTSWWDSEVVFTYFQNRAACFVSCVEIASRTGLSNAEVETMRRLPGFPPLRRVGHAYGYEWTLVEAFIAADQSFADRGGCGF